MTRDKKISILAACLMTTMLLSVPIVHATVANTYYWWDNLYFLGNAQTFKYAHPERNYYGINVFSSWGMYGTKLFHLQLDQTTSGALAQAGPVAIGAAIGAAIGSLGGGVGAVAGAAIGALIGVYLAASGSFILLDESGCLWSWVSTAFINWVVSWYWLGPAAIAAAFLLYGYLRVGSLTIYDAVGAGSPSPPSYYVSSTYSYGTTGAGSVTNPNSWVGSSDDGQYTILYGGNYGDGGWIIGTMNTAAAGHMYIYGYSSPGYYTHLIVYTSKDGTTFTTLSSQTVNPTSGPHLIDCGTTTSYFLRIKLVATDDNYYSARLNVDAVHVVGASENLVSSINSYGHEGAGSVTNPNNLRGANDGLYTTLYGGNRGDSGWIVGNMNTPATGHVYVYGYSSAGYYTHLIVSVSNDGYSWNTLSSQTINPTTNPYYIDCGSTTYAFNYIKFYAPDDTGMSARINLDAVHVLS
jgi:hypothetical protein